VKNESAPPALYLLFFTSGALGLVYEVLWMRRFTVLFGATSLAATATLSAFFLGTAIGSLVLGSRSRTWSHPLRAFGLLEIGVGLSALLVRPILHLYAAAYPHFYQALAPWPAAFAVVKLVLAILAVGLPTFFMGGTLPALGEAVARSGRSLGIPVGGLYATNVLGAAIGALAAPFALLPTLGGYRAYGAAVAGSVILGLSAWVLGARSSRPTADEPSPPPRETTNASSPRLVLVLAAWSGLSTLGLQVLWTRMFSLVHENSVYSFAIVVVVFLAGLAGGAALARAGLRRGAEPRRLLGGAWAVAGVFILISPRLFSALTNGLEYLPDAGWLSSLARLLAVAGATIAPACIALGLALPLLLEIAGRGQERSAGPLIGRLLAANTAGAIAGPLLVTFVVAPALGLWNSVALLGLLTIGAGAGAGLRRRERWVAAVATAAVLLLLSPARLPPARVSAADDERLVSVREGSYGTTAVVEDLHDRWITVNNSYVLGGAAGADEERWQGHLPLLLHPKARSVAFIGLGTGITASAVRLHAAVEHVVALELVPEVVAAARADFAGPNLRLLEDPRLTMVTDDGRNYLAGAPPPFDVIVGDLLVPWRPAEAALYTREHFVSVRQALAPGGAFCQWLPLYQLTEEQLAIIARTFLDVFPQATVWRGNFLPGEPTLALVGQRDAQPLEAAGIDARAQALAALPDARNPFLKHPAGLWLHLVGPLRVDGAWPGPGERNLDDEPRVELLSARHRAPLVGARMEDLLARLAPNAFDGTPLAALPSTHRAWRDTGMALGRASLASRTEEGQRQVVAILRTLPVELRRALGVDAT
jgi:spermidine synthase